MVNSEFKAKLDAVLLSDDPDQLFRSMFDDNPAWNLIPEIWNMKGCDHSAKPPKTNWHPEGDVFEHTMLVLRQMRKMNGNLIQMYAALGHDFGKPLVSRDIWPHMYNHEKLGLKPISDFCVRLSLDKNVYNTMCVIAYNHTMVHTVKDLRHITLVRLIDRLQSTPIGVRACIDVCAADARGRGPTYENLDYSANYDRILRAEEIINKVNFEHILDKEINPDRVESIYVKALSKVGV